MKNTWDKIRKIEIDKRLLALCMALVLSVVLIPVVRIMQYCVPWYDDFSYGKLVKDAVDQGGGFFDVIKAAAESSKSSYYSFQGTFASCFLMSIMPAVWGTDKYVYGLLFVLGVFLLGIFLLVHVLLRDVLKADRWIALAVECVIAATCILLYRSPIEGLFWYDAAVHYTAMHGFGLILMAMLIKAIYTENKILRGVLVVCSVPLGFCVGGANYVTILQMGLLAVSLLGWGAIFRKKEVLWALPATVSLGMGIAVNVTAWGNNHRLVHFEQQILSPMEAVWRSFVSAFTYLGEFTGWMTLVILITLIPLAVQIASATKFRFRLPGLVLLWSFCLYATGFTPTLYIMGHTLISRATSIAMFTFQMLLFLNWFYLIGWGYRYLQEKKGKKVQFKNYLCFYTVTALAVIGIFAAEPNKGGKFTTYVSYYFVHTGEAYNYYHEYLDRVALCESDEKDVIVRPLVFKPWVLCLGDLSSDPNYEPNRFMAAYFGKNSIVCLTEEEEQALKNKEGQP